MSSPRMAKYPPPSRRRLSADCTIGINGEWPKEIKRGSALADPLGDPRKGYVGFRLGLRQNRVCAVLLIGGVGLGFDEGIERRHAEQSGGAERSRGAEAGDLKGRITIGI